MKRKVFWMGMAVVLLCSFSIADAAQTLTKMGASPFFKPPLTSIEDLNKMVYASQESLAEGFRKAGYPELYDAFMAQFPSAEITMVQIQKGDALQWMMYRRNGKGSVRVMKDLVWGGKEPFDAFEFYIELNDKRYQMIVPLICSNVALKDVTDVPKVAEAPPPPPPAPNQSPVCRAQIAPESLFGGQPFTVDASGSSDVDGQITSMVVTVTDPQGEVVEKKVVNEAPFATEVVMPGGGAHNVNVTVVDDTGAEATSEECQTVVYGMKRGRILADVAFFRIFDPLNYGVGRVGYEYRFTPNYSLVAMVGAFLAFEDSYAGDNAFTADLLFNYRYDRFFAGLGVGGWFMDDENLNGDDNWVDVVFNTGVRLFGDPEAFNTSLFFEVRSDVEQMDDIVDLGRWGVGLRFQF